MTTGLRALNRATLARQLLLRRADLSVPAALSSVGGLQAQTPQRPLDRTQVPPPHRARARRISAEGEALLAFLAPGAPHDIAFVDPD
jgi:hypothetical protein